MRSLCFSCKLTIDQAKGYINEKRKRMLKLFKRTARENRWLLSIQNSNAFHHERHVSKKAHVQIRPSNQVDGHQCYIAYTSHAIGIAYQKISQLRPFRRLNYLKYQNFRKLIAISWILPRKNVLFFSNNTRAQNSFCFSFKNRPFSKSPLAKSVKIDVILFNFHAKIVTDKMPL